MSKSEDDPQRAGLNQKPTPRRNFLKSATSAVGGFVLWRAGNTPIDADTAAAKDQDATDSPSYPTRYHLPKPFQEYPVPSYLPRNYGLNEIYTERPDGLGGPEELTFWYVNRNDLVAFNNPLAVFVTSKPQRRSLARDREGELVAFSMQSGETVQAVYYDGTWVLAPNGSQKLPDGQSLAWETSNTHSLTFRFRNFTIAIAGSQLAGISFNELQRVASSIA